jgi:hypothetical protein
MNNLDQLIQKHGGTINRSAAGGASSDLVKKYGGQIQEPGPFNINTETAAQPSPAKRAFTNIASVYSGIEKGAFSTVKNSLGLVSKGLEALAPAPKSGTLFGQQVGGERADESVNKAIPDKLVTPENTAEKIGFGAEQIAEFLLPTGEVTSAQKGLEAAVDASKLGKAAKVVSKVVGKAALEGAGGAAVRTAQTGDIKEGAKAGAVFGGIKLGTGIVGQALKSAGVPEWLYSKLFKNTYEDMYQELNTQSLQTLQQTNPEWFKQMTEAGIIKLGKNGAVVVDNTIAKQALDRGLQGNIRNMAVVVKKGLIDSEASVQDIAKQHADNLIQLTHPQTYANVLNGLSKEFEDVGFGADSAKAAQYAQKAVKGVLTPEEAVGLRRLLDGLRIKKSYTQIPGSPLSLGQHNLKILSDTLRGQVNDLPGMAKVMEEYSFNIEALQALAKEAARRGNNQALSLIDSIILSGGLAGGEPVASMAIGVGRKLLNSPSGLTKTGQLIEKGGTLTRTGAALKGAASRLLKHNGQP